MMKWFRRRKDNKALANNTEQELSTLNKLDVMKEAKKKLDALCSERRFQILQVEFERRRV